MKKIFREALIALFGAFGVFQPWQALAQISQGELPGGVHSGTSRETDLGETDLGEMEWDQQNAELEDIVATADSWGDLTESVDTSWAPQSSTLDLLLIPQSTQDDLDLESSGEYKKKQKMIQQCFDSRASLVWKEFSPFFHYKYDMEYKKFAALFLALWKNESNYTKPKRGVIIQTNCPNTPPFYADSLPGQSLNQDLERARKMENRLKKKYSRCNLRMADYGPMQWNQKWRLSKRAYRPQIEMALRISTQYGKESIQKLSMPEMTRLIKFNSHALFLLGGLNIKDGVDKPREYIRNYNSKTAYQKKVFRDYQSFKLKFMAQAQCKLPALTQAKK
jgi:hypothetical protein